MKKALSMILALIMVVCVLPMAVTAEEITPLGEAHTAILGGSTDYYTVSGKVVMSDNNTVYLQDESGALGVLMHQRPDCSLGDTITLTGFGRMISGRPQIEGADPVGDIIPGDGPIRPLITTIAEAGNHLYEYVKIKNLTITEIFDNSGTYSTPDVTVTDGTSSIQIYKCVMDKVDGQWAFEVGDVVNVTAAVSSNLGNTCLRTTVANELEDAIAAQAELDPNIKDIPTALTAGTMEGAKVFGQLVYRFGNYGGLNSAILQYKHEGEIYGLQVYNALETYSNGEPIEFGDWVLLTGKLGPYGGVQQIQSLTSIERAPEALEGEDASEAQEFDSLADAIAAKGSLLSEYIYIKNVRLGAYSDNGSTVVYDANNSATKINIYRAADYRRWHSANDVVNIYAVMSAYNSTSQLRNGYENDYVKNTPDTDDPIVTLPQSVLAAEVGMDYTINATVADYSPLETVTISYTIGVDTYNELGMDNVDGDDYSFVIPGNQIVGGVNELYYTVDAFDALGNKGTASGTVDINDVPQILETSPVSNYASGEDKRPVVSVRFANAGVDPTITMTINGENVYPVVEGNTATFTPDEDMPNAKYTVVVRITRQDGNYAEATWSYYVGEATFRHYFGQLHSHTAQYSDGSGTLQQALEYAKNQAENIDFIAITDHSNYFDNSTTLGDLSDPTKGLKNSAGTMTKWQEARATTESYNDPNFVAVYGYEMTWSGQYGHMNTFNSVGFESRNNSKYVVKNGPGLVAYYDRLVEIANLDRENGRSTTINQFNHPGSTFGTFEDFAHYTPAYDELITMLEVGNGEGKVGGSMYWPSYEMYTLALDKGWHIAPTNNQDNHKGGWGDSNTCRDVIYTDDFSVNGLYEAMRNRAMYATEDNDLEIIYTLNDQFMGACISEELEEVNIHVDFNDPTDRVSKVSVIANGGVTVAQKSFGTKTGTWDITLPKNYTYYYIRIDQADADIAVTAPVWVGEVLKIGVTSVEKDTTIELKDKPIEFTTTVFNYEAEPMTVKQVVYSVDGTPIETVTNEITVASNSENKDCVWEYTPTEIGRHTLEVEVTVEYKENEYVFTQNISFNVRDGADMKTMVIDAGHSNFYVSGNYPNSDTAFIELAAQYGIVSERVSTPITDEVLEDCVVLVLTVPFKGSGFDLSDSLYSQAELDAIARYAERGGNFIITSKSDRLEPSSQNQWASNITNGILESIGASARIGKGIVADPVKKTNESYRLHFMGKDHYNFESKIAEYLPETTNSMFSCYNGAPVILNGATPVVTAFDTTFVSSYADYYTGSSFVPNPETHRSSYYYDACGDQEDVVVLAEETLPGGGLCVTAGVTFFSTFEVKVELENAGTLQNTNYQICCNLFKMLNPDEVTPIANIMHENKVNRPYTIEGWVTSNASGFDKNTAFFDCIYVQDESGRGINVFPVAGNYQIGQKVRISGMTSSYMGEIELNAGNEYGGSVTDITLPYSERAELIDLEYTLFNAQTVDTYSVSTDRLQQVLDEMCLQTRYELVEPQTSSEDGEVPTGYLMDLVSCKGAMTQSELGNLVEIYGTVVGVEFDNNGVLGAIHVQDETGTAVVFLDGYINCDCADCTKDAQGYHDLSGVVEGAVVRVRGVASMGQNSYTNSEQIGGRIRIRNRADIELWGDKEIPVAVIWGDADGNGNVNSADAALILRWVVGLATDNEIDLVASRVTEDDGIPTSADAAQILRWVVGLAPVLKP